jgi:predicted SAM-dependent methyltransferase
MKIIDNFNFFILWLKKRKKYGFIEKYKGINLGSEDNTIPEYVGIDGSPLIFIIRNKIIPRRIKEMVYNKTCTANHRPYKEFEKKAKSIPFIHHNLLYGIPFKKESVDNIYTSHFLEHITLENGKKILRECFRVMKKGGILRICIPSIEQEIERIHSAIRKYKNGDTESIQEFITTSQRDMSSKNFSLHRKLYGYSELKEILEKRGFKKVKKVRFKEGYLPLVDKIEMRDGLIIEAIK